MKTTTIIILLLLFLGSPMATAQDLLDALKQTADMHNEAHGENNGDNSDSELTPQQEEWQRQWEAEWIAQQNVEFLDEFDNKYLRCMAMMEMYVYMYLKLVNEHKLGDVGMSECDAYGMQTLALAASTTIMYCPEEMNQLSDVDLSKISSDFKSALEDLKLSGTGNSESTIKLLTYWKYIRDKMINGTNASFDGVDIDYFVLTYIIGFFKPRYIIPRTLEIAQKMEALGCSKPN